jgi:hypothetical protein
MGDGDAPAPQEAVQEVPAGKGKPKGDPKYVKVDECPFCHEQKPVSHRQWCKQNPKKRDPIGHARKRDPAKKARARKPKGEAEAFVEKREVELKGDGSKPANPPPEKKQRKSAGKMGWIMLAAIVVLGLGVLFAFMRGTQGETPKDQQQVEPRNPANSHIPGEGDVFVPGLPG